VTTIKQARDTGRTLKTTPTQPTLPSPSRTSTRINSLHTKRRTLRKRVGTLSNVDRTSAWVSKERPSRLKLLAALTASFTSVTPKCSCSQSNQTFSGEPSSRKTQNSRKHWIVSPLTVASGTALKSKVPGLLRCWTSSMLRSISQKSAQIEN